MYALRHAVNNVTRVHKLTLDVLGRRKLVRECVVPCIAATGDAYIAQDRERERERERERAHGDVEKSVPWLLCKSN